MATPRCTCPGWLRPAVMNTVTPVAITINPIMLAKRSSTSVKPDSDRVVRARRSRSRRIASAPRVGRGADGDAALDELRIRIVGRRRGEQQARLARVRAQIRVAVQVKGLGAECPAIRRV